MVKNILIYNNQTGILEKIAPILCDERIRIHTASTIFQLAGMLRLMPVHLILVDMPRCDVEWEKGIETISYIRKESVIPLMVVSRETAEIAMISALEAGADDYVNGDCSTAVLVAKIRMQMERFTQLTGLKEELEHIFSVEDLVIDDFQKTVTVDGRPVRLTPIEYKILSLLVRQRGRVFSNNQIYESIWHMPAFGTDNTIAVHVRHIREKIECDPKQPKYLKVVWGSGYKVG